MENTKNNYTNFILTVIAVAMIGILFKGQIITASHAASSYHKTAHKNGWNNIIATLKEDHRLILSACR